MLAVDGLSLADPDPARTARNRCLETSVPIAISPFWEEDLWYVDHSDTDYTITNIASIAPIHGGRFPQTDCSDNNKYSPCLSQAVNSTTSNLAARSASRRRTARPIHRGASSAVRRRTKEVSTPLRRGVAGSPVRWPTIRDNIRCLPVFRI